MFLKAEVFLGETSFPEKNRMKSCTLGDPQSETVRFENKIFITLNGNNYWFLNDRSFIVSAIKIELKNFNHD